MASVFRKIVLPITGVGLALFILIQFVPFGKDRTNPPVVLEPSWDSPATRELARRACFDCHSYETKYPWYSSVAPASWLLAMDFTGGRESLNFSDWRAGELGADRIARQVTEGRMPLSRYLMLHPEARLTDAEREQLAEGLRNSLGQ